MNILFYLEDDSVQVCEPKTVNSGIPQGSLIRRHRIIKQDATNGQHFTVNDFNVGQQVTFYGKTFKIVGCDTFTQEFLSKLNIQVPENSEFPSDPYELKRQELMSRMKATRPVERNFTLKKFLENDRRVLKFFCVWDDSNSMFGDLRHMVLHYFLSDDTIEIRESIPANSGRECNTLFLRRCRLPKHHHTLRVNGRTGPERPEEYYSDCDMMIGAVIHLYGRPFIICDCDEFTKNYYRENYGVETFEPVHFEDYQEDPNAEAVFDLAAHQKAHASSDKSLLIGQEGHPKKDFRKLIKYDGIILRFLAGLNTNKQVDRDRRFVVSFHLADDTISIFEPPSRNSGILGGKFLEQNKIKKPDGTYYNSKDLYIGKLNLFRRSIGVL